MATPRADSCSAPSGAVLACGRAAPSGLPSWALGLDVGQWVQVPVAAALSTLNPNNNPALNPIYPTSRWVSHTGIVSAWCGACFDQANNVLHLPLQGGHGDYSGNEPYRIDLTAETPAWEMLRPPSGAIGYGGSELNLNDGQEATGLYSDGRLRAGHSYNHNLWIPGRGVCISQVAETYASGAGGKRLFMDLNQSTGESSLALDWAGATQAGVGHGFAVWDSVRSRVFVCGAETARPYTLDLTAGTYTARGSSGNILAGFARGAYCAGIDLVAAISNPTAGAYRAQAGFSVFDPATGTDYQPGMSGSWPSGFTFNGKAGMEWDAENQRLLLWNNATNTAQIATLTPPASPTTEPWVRGSIAVPGSNAVTPSAAAANGTYGRFALAPDFNGAFLLNSTSGPLYFVRTH